MNGKPHTLGAFFVINHKTPLDLGAPPVGPVAERAHREGALIELDKHNWPWSMAIVPIMPVDLFELSNNHVWQTTFGIRDFGEAPADYMKRRTRRARLHRSGAGSISAFRTTTPCSTADSGSGRRPARPRAFTRSRSGLAASMFISVRTRGFDGAAWLAGLNQGRSFVTTGPMLLVTLERPRPGRRASAAGLTACKAGP